MRLSLAVLCVLVAAILTAAFLPVTAGAERQSQPGTAAPKTAEEHGMGWKCTPPGQYEQYVDRHHRTGSSRHQWTSPPRCPRWATRTG